MKRRSKERQKKIRMTILDRYGTQVDFSIALGEGWSDSVVSRSITGIRKMRKSEMKQWASLLKKNVKDLFPEYEDEIYK